MDVAGILVISLGVLTASLGIITLVVDKALTPNEDRSLWRFLTGAGIGAIITGLTLILIN